MFRLHLKVHGTTCHRTELFDRPILHGRQISGMKNPHQIPVSFRAADIFPVIADNSGRDLLGFREHSAAHPEHYSGENGVRTSIVLRGSFLRTVSCRTFCRIVSRGGARDHRETKNTG